MPATQPSLPSRGELADHPLPRVLLDLGRSGFSGRLDLAHDEDELRVGWRKGAPVSSESNRDTAPLSQALLAGGRIDESALAKLAAHREKTGAAEGVALLALGLVEPRELVLAIREQISRRLVDAFGWRQGSFAVDASEVPEAKTEAFRVDPLQVIQDGLAAYWRPDRILEDLSDRLELHAAPAEPFESVAARLRAGPDTAAIVDAIDPQRSFAQTAATSLSPARLAVAWILAQTDALTFSDGPPERDAGPPEEAGDDDDAPRLEFEIEVREAPAQAAEKAGDGQAALLELPSAKAEELRKEVLALHERLDEIDHYEVLGIASDASDAAIKKAYFAAAKRFHPDAVTRLGLTSIHRQANELFAQIAQAYQTLSNPKRRHAYDHRDDEGSKPATNANRIAQAETLFRKGEVLVKVGNFTGALDFLRPCVELWPEEADYQALLGWALHKAKGSDPVKAREHLEKADALRGDDPLTLFRLGMVLRKLGDTEAAQIYLDRSKSLEREAKK